MNSDDAGARPGPSFHEPSAFSFDIDTTYPAETPPVDIFADLVRHLQSHYNISRGVLILREAEGTRYLVSALVSDTGERKHLSLLLPGGSSLIRQAAEDGGIYTENFFGLFDGSLFEKNLLIGPETESFMLHPVKYEGRVVGIVGLSSRTTDAFVTLDHGALEPVLTQLGRRLVLQGQHSAS
ncbi:MAG: hypothetical protein D6800_03500 [Candidatus Zixiibacteriota bacterium]|nr:MAG: hypothetical protein D6800_03500 [candidate division Zixibacteria bacterium]